MQELKQRTQGVYDVIIAGAGPVGLFLACEPRLDSGGRASLQALDGVCGDRVRYVASEAKDCLGLRALLVRPDGFVAWASDATPSPEEVTRAAARWFATREPGERAGKESR
jgi:hypothetical protein